MIGPVAPQRPAMSRKLTEFAAFERILIDNTSAPHLPKNCAWGVPSVPVNPCPHLFAI
jgi:hypothetical protein